MARQKAVTTTEETTKPKKGKQRRSKARLDAIRMAGMQIACMVGAITALSSIRWEVTSQSVQGLKYVVTLGSRGMICRCPANADGKKICKHVVGVYRILDMKWWKGRIKKRIQILRPKLRCPNEKCRSKEVVKNGKRKCKRKNLVQKRKCNSCGRIFSGREGSRGGILTRL